MNCAVRDRSKTIEAKLFIHGLWLLSQSGLKANSRYNQMDSLHAYTVFVFTRKRQFGEHRIGVFWPMKSLKLICANPHFSLRLGCVQSASGLRRDALGNVHRCCQSPN